MGLSSCLEAVMQCQSCWYGGEDDVFVTFDEMSSSSCGWSLVCLGILLVRSQGMCGESLEIDN